MAGKCVICGAIVENYEPEYCCNSRDCGCMGYPIEPCVCDKEECNEKAFGKKARKERGLIMSKNLLWSEDSDVVYGLKSEFKDKEEFKKLAEEEFETFDLGKCEIDINDVKIKACISTLEGVPAESLLPLSSTDVVIENYYISDVEFI
ncbi:hypothetical protein [Wukongibacter sp. M2B1]|uniref:hypothetical protein n=1 Tax=Wukongibacter sp. M2B1 TaxID=3088895 RepID=UPI003D7AD475